MKIKYFFLVAVDTDGEVVGVVAEAGQQSKLIPATWFDKNDRLYLYREDEESDARAGMQYYNQYFWNEITGDGSTKTYQKARRDAISPKPWTMEIRPMEVSL